MGDQELWRWIRGAEGEFIDPTQPVTFRRTLSNAGARSVRENLSNSAPQWRDPMTPHSTSIHILWHGESKSSTMIYIVDSNTSGQGRMFLDLPGSPADDLRISFYWGPTKKTWDLPGIYKGNGTNVSCCPLHQRNVTDHPTSGEILR